MTSLKVLLLTPPMTQLNTPYPATAYLTGFLRQQGYDAVQRDLAIELMLTMLSKPGLDRLFAIVEDRFAAVDDDELPDSVYHFFAHFPLFRQRVEPCIRFLQGKDSSLALRIASRRFLPEGPQFEALHQMEELSGDLLERAFGDMGLQDKAKYLATLFINDLAAVVKDGADPDFEMSRYGERLASSNPSFDDLYTSLKGPHTYTRQLLTQLLEHHLQQVRPSVVGITVPFPGNMLGALQLADACRQLDPTLTLVLGGGFVNTELRSLKDPRVFEFVDYIMLDDGERPLLTLLEYCRGLRDIDQLTRTYRLANGSVHFQPENPMLADFSHAETGTPCYDGLALENYLALCEVLNPMHRIWSDGRWNKLTVAHGCYWKKCSFCDISLDYIGRYQEAGAAVIVDRIERLIAETGQTGFHFVDEAAPPKVLFALAELLIERGIVITWWCNIRFEKTFSAEKCRLLAESGCVAVSGGLEVASDRLLKLMQKGVSVQQVARVTRNFADAGILVHAYLMYGFPTQTERETVASLEMVRQLMLNGCFQSAYWHRFAATVHSPVGLDPQHYRIHLLADENVLFAENEVAFVDPVAADHELLGRGLKKALYNYMHGVGFDYPVSFWFEKTVADPDIDPDFIATALNS